MIEWIQRKLNPNYSIQLNESNGFVSGIVRFQLVTSRDELKQQAVRFTLTIQGDKGSQHASKEVVPADETNCWIGLHSHLLEDGSYVVEWSANDWRDRCKITVQNRGPLANGVRSALNRQRIKPFLIEPCEANLYELDNTDLAPWFDQADCQRRLDKMLQDGRVPEYLEGPFRQFLSQGWFEIENHVDPRLLRQLRVDMNEAAARGDSGFSLGSSQRLELLHLKYKSFWKLINYRPTQKLVDLLMQVPTNVCQVLGFVNGSQQDPHQDTVHLTAFPSGYMCGVWLALEDVQPDSGELIVYPGSHRWPAVLMNQFSLSKVSGEEWVDFGNTVVKRWDEMLKAKATKPLIYRPKAGSLLIWHDRLMHGGLLRTNMSLTRRSCVTHYFARGSLCFHDSTGLPGKVIHRGSRGPSVLERARWRNWSH